MIQLRLFLIWVFVLCFSIPSAAEQLEIVATFKNYRPGNPAMDTAGNAYVTLHPMGNPPQSVLKVDPRGQHKPFPDLVWSSAPNVRGEGIAAAIGITISAENDLYVLDMGDGIREPRLVVWDLNRDELKRIYVIPAYARRTNSFLQDFAIDLKNRRAYIADRGQADLTGEPVPAIVVIDLGTGQVWRVLERHPTLMPGNTPMKASGKDMAVRQGKETHELFIGLNPIAIDPANEWVYYSTMTAGEIHRIPAADLANKSLSDGKLSRNIQRYGPKPVTSEGITVDNHGRVYVADVENNAIGFVIGGQYHTYIKDKRLQWPSNLSKGPDGYIYVVINQFHLSRAFNNGKEGAELPYYLARFPNLGPISLE